MAPKLYTSSTLSVKLLSRSKDTPPQNGVFEIKNTDGTTQKLRFTR